jgi:hypothetical protein
MMLKNVFWVFNVLGTICRDLRRVVVDRDCVSHCMLSVCLCIGIAGMDSVEENRGRHCGEDSAFCWVAI